MSGEITIGSIVEGRVTAIKEYGAFVSLSAGRSGLVHISQIASEYVKQVEDYLSVGDTVQVKITDISDTGKISLSIKQVAPLERKDGKKPEERRPASRSDAAPSSRPSRRERSDSGTDKMNSLEEKLKKWMKSSEERMQDLQSKQKRK